MGGTSDTTKVDPIKGTVADKWYKAEQDDYTNWDYAIEADNRATLFMDTNCDFWWDPNTGNDGQVYVWNDVKNENRTERYTVLNSVFWGFFKFFTGANADDKKHSIAFEGTKTPQS